MAKTLTPKSIENMKAGAARREIPDAGCRGLYLIVQPVTGRKSFAVRYRFNGAPTKLTLGSWPALQLAAARKAATHALHELAQGRDPATMKFDAEAAAKKAAAERAADSVDHWAKLFIERHAKKHTRPRSWQQCEHVFHNIVLPVWSGRIVHDIKRRDIIEVVEGVAEDRPVMANRTLGHLSKFFNWLCERDVIPASPCAGVKPPAKETPRERILTDGEIKALWTACGAIGGRVGPCVKLLLLTGQRCGEVVGMRRSEISGDVWSLSRERTKNKRQHDVPLSTQALAIIDEIPVIAGEEDCVFTTSETKRLGKMSHAKDKLDAHMKPKTPWVIHDLRRTCASGMAKLGIRLPVIEKCLNHASGSFRGIVRVYQRHDFAAEMREALQRWANHVDAIVRGEASGKVVQIRAGH
jgi:integrase